MFSFGYDSKYVIICGSKCVRIQVSMTNYEECLAGVLGNISNDLTIILQVLSGLVVIVVIHHFLIGSYQ